MIVATVAISKIDKTKPKTNKILVLLQKILIQLKAKRTHLLALDYVQSGMVHQ